MPVAMAATASSSNKAIEVFQNGLPPGKVLLLDGGTGEELLTTGGVPDDRTLWSATALVEPRYHNHLFKVHQSFLAAGAQAITTNSYSVIPGVGFSKEEMKQYCAVAGSIAKRAVMDSYKEENNNNNKNVLVLGSVGPLMESYRADTILPHDQGVESYSILVHSLSPHVDAILAETLSCTDEALQVIQAVSSLSSSLPLLISFTVNSKGRLRGGQLANAALATVLEACRRQKNVTLLALLFNCSEPEAITMALTAVQQDDSLTLGRVRLGAYANRLTPVDDQNWTLAESEAPQPQRDDMSPSRYCTEFVKHWVEELNVQVVGGCCAITPAHIAYLKQHLPTA